MRTPSPRRASWARTVTTAAHVDGGSSPATFRRPLMSFDELLGHAYIPFFNYNENIPPA